MIKTIIIAVVFALSALLSVGLIFLGRNDFYSKLPDPDANGVYVRYIGNAEKPWEGIDLAVEQLFAVEHEGKKLLEHLIIEVVPFDGTVDGLEANGTVRYDGPPLGPTYTVLVVRQLRDGDRVRNACISAIHHEFIEHALPTLLHDNLNHKHEDKALREIAAEMETRCLMRTMGATR